MDPEDSDPAYAAITVKLPDGATVTWTRRDPTCGVDLDNERALMRLTGVTSWPVVIVDALNALIPAQYPFDLDYGDDRPWNHAVRIAHQAEQRIADGMDHGQALGMAYSQAVASSWPSAIFNAVVRNHPVLRPPRYDVTTVTARLDAAADGVDLRGLFEKRGLDSWVTIAADGTVVAGGPDA